MKNFLRSLVLGLCACALCCSSALAADTLRIGGGPSPMENIFKRIKQPFEEKTGITLELVENGPIDAYVEMMHGRLDVAAGGYGSLKEWMAAVEKTKGTDAAPQGRVSWHIVGDDYVMVFSHKDIPVSALSTEQIRDIFTGKIGNWKEVGGPDLPITVVLVKGSGLLHEFQRVVLGGAEYTPAARYVDTGSAMKSAVIGTRGGVAIGTLAQSLDEAVNVIDYEAPQRFISMMWRLDSPKRELVQTLYQYVRSPEAKEFTLTYHMLRQAGREGHRHGAGKEHGHEHK